MRKTVFINIEKDAVYNEVKKTCEHEALNASREGKSFEKVRVEDAADELIDTYWNDAKSVAADVMKDYIAVVRVSEDNGDVCFELFMPGNYDGRRTEAVETQVFLMIVYYIVYKWMERVMPDANEKYLNAVEGAKGSVLMNLRKRERPKRRALPEKMEGPRVEVEWEEDENENEDENEDENG